MKIKKQISMIMADLSQGHINIFRGDTSRSLFFVVSGSEVSARRLPKELINHNLYLIA